MELQPTKLNTTKMLHKFGDCYILKEGKPFKLENRKFEIATWKVYEIKSENEAMEIPELNGTKINIGFNFGITILPKTNEILQQKGIVNTFSRVGTKPVQDMLLSHIHDMQERLNNWGLDLNVLDKKSKYYQKFQDIGVAQFASVTAPGMKLVDLLLYCQTIATVTIFDDFFDNLKDFWPDGAELCCYEMSKAVDAFSSILLGKIDNVCSLEDNGFPKFIPMCKLFLKFRKDVVAMGYTAEQTAPLFEHFVLYLEMVFWEGQGWTDPDESDNKTIRKFYFFYREITISVGVIAAVLCLVKNIHLNENIRRDPLFQSLQRQFGRHIVLSNDIFSLRKEIENNENSNIVIIRSHKKTPQQAFDKTIDEINQNLEHFKKLERQLVRKFPNNKDLIKYFVMLRDWMDGNFQWMFLSRRYGNDCFEIFLNDEKQFEIDNKT